MSDVTYKRRDTWPPLKTTLMQKNQETGAEEAIDLATCIKVTCLLKPPGVGGLIERTCTGPAAGGIKTATGAKKGQIEFYFHVADLEVLGDWAIEFEIEWPEKAVEPGAVMTKQFQTVPNEGTRGLTVIPDLGSA